MLMNLGLLSHGICQESRDRILLASGRNDHSESGEINQFQPLENSQCTSATPFLS